MDSSISFRSLEEGLNDFAPGVFNTTAPLILQTSDAFFLAYYEVVSETGPYVVCRSSKDGSVWSEESIVFSGISGLSEALIDIDGEVHLFSIMEPDGKSIGFEGEENRPLVGELIDSRLDIWYVRSHSGRTEWSEPRMIWKGYTGALNSVIQTRTGRIILPFSYAKDRTWANRGDGFKEFTFVGQFDSTVIYSDDAGDTWKQSNDLSIQTPDIVSAYGAVEPVVLELDDCIWMLIRTQLGRFYESRSTDGEIWSRPKPTPIISSDSPAGLVRLSDGRIVLLWNNCLRYPYAYGGRQVLHGAVSADNGKTWIGYREIARDRLRNLPPPPTGDHGTAYPFPIVTKDDKVVFRTGQGQGRVEIKLMDPAYLYQTHQQTDWSLELDDWSIYGTNGVELVDTPEPALSIQRVDDEYPSAAVWNFPMGFSGKIEIEITMQPGCSGLNIGLTDHYSSPFDLDEAFFNVFNIFIIDGEMGCGNLKVNNRHMLLLEWDCSGGCLAYLDKVFIGEYESERRAAGICYIRFTALADKPETGSILISSVKTEAWSSISSF